MEEHLKIAHVFSSSAPPLLPSIWVESPPTTHKNSTTHDKDPSMAGRKLTVVISQAPGKNPVKADWKKRSRPA